MVGSLSLDSNWVRNLELSQLEVVFSYAVLQVTIPQHPGGQLQFQTPKVSSSAEGAKVLAAEITLSHMSAAAAFAEGTVCIQSAQSHVSTHALVFVSLS